jgi:hypothetical protein
VDVVVLRRPAFDDPLAVAGRFLAQPQVLDHMLRRLDDDEALVVEALAPGAAGNLWPWSGSVAGATPSARV